MSEIIIGLIVAFAGVFFAYRKGRKDVETQHEIDNHNEYVATKKRIEDAFVPGGDGAIRDSLRNRPDDKR